MYAKHTHENMYAQTYTLTRKIPLNISWCCMCANSFLEWTLYTMMWYKTTHTHKRNNNTYKWKDRWCSFNDIESSSLFLFTHLTVFPKSCLPKSVFLFSSYFFIFSQNIHMPLKTCSISQPSILSPLNYKVW